MGMPENRSLTTSFGLRSLVGAVALGLLPVLGCSSGSDSSTAADDAGEGGALGDAIATDDAGDDASDGGADPSRHADPEDLDPTNGDPSLDIAASWLYFDANQPWVRVEFSAPWPPPATL